MSKFSKAGVIVKKGDDGATQTLNEVLAALAEHSIEAVIEHNAKPLLPGIDAVSTEEIGKTCDLALVIGGDGTLLYAARELVDHGVPIVGINRGRLGFLVDVPPTDDLEQLKLILSGDYYAEERIILETRILRDGESVNTSLSFNDTVVRVKDVLQIMDFDIIIDDVLVTHQRADGLIMATPSGSTAYSLSNGGPIVGPTINAVILQPICPHTLTSRPLMVDAKSTVRVHLWDDKVMEAQVVCDGQIYMPATLGDMIEMRVKDQRVTLLHPTSYDYHRILREKLNWG